ncbi:MAG: orotate phosphoribosyltransferase [Desulfobacula sp.]|jgi:orotate phosphoribosyltransferase|uniref:orotate phosphoribosyltransferase n=1 Tax=Desulfobacula sp. TaxID=2593537 RepID=UPI001D87A420|nr:orotate phosphoribosyltransferase [Desulfobacula sp.]MBT3806619.1 orotate phosphoribosyltransferase [Desulfobacula sp.]MBT4025847.1 orotate phosphoribosyltransferase [Desulfobacula sp.]MBT4200621.1 orotate phosphoribosyltransferase [Desulfobacula sp.]MBT4507688.1 orotate phosphoribosyltransferase [Desulfobacula sp.]
MTYKEEFIEFLVECNALRFGEFELKSGRIAPYFINTGMFDTGLKIKKLGTFYAKAVQEHFFDNFDGIYGPAYKGIPLCISAAQALSDMGVDKGYVFNRKEAKTYADKSLVVGMPLTKSSRLILVDDVITSGKAIRESLEVLKSCNNPVVKGIIISVNRQEKGKTEKNALKEVEEILGIPIHAVVSITDIKKYLHNKKINGRIMLDDAMLAKINVYLEEYGTI